MNNINCKLYNIKLIKLKINKRNENYQGSMQFSTADSPEDYAIKAKNAKDYYYPDRTLWFK